MKHKPMDFAEFDQLFTYDPKTGEIRNKVDRGSEGRYKAGWISTSNHSLGYLQLQFKNNGRKYCYLAHRAAWLLHYRKDPGKMEVDHINHDRADNRIENLRLVNRSGQCRNWSKLKRNTSGVTGVVWDKVNKKWMAQIGINGKCKKLGRYKDKWDAICARKSADNRYGFHENHGA